MSMRTTVRHAHFSFFSEIRRMRIFDLASAGLFNIYKLIYTLNSSGGKAYQRVILAIQVIHYYFSQQKCEAINIVFILQFNILFISTIFN